MIENNISVKNLLVSYKVFGETLSGTIKPMLILHGWGSNSSPWQQVGELLAQQGVKVIVPDLPGFGQSETPKTTWSLSDYVEWVKDFSDQLPECSHGFYLLGHSFGGALAAKFTVKYNQNIEKLFLVASALVREKTAKKTFFYRISKIVKIFSFLPYYPLARKIFYKFILRKSDYPYVQGIMKDIYLKVISDDLTQYISFVKVPTIIIWGDKDKFTPIENAYLINKKIHHSKLAVIANGSHALQIESPEMLTEKILQHIAVQGEMLSLKNII